MKIYKKRLRRGKIKQFVERLLIWVFAFIGALFVLSWSIDVFVEAGKFYFEEKRISIVNQPVSNVAVAEETPTDAPVLIEEVESESQAVSSLPPSAEIVKSVADKYDIDWRILWAVCKVESNCNSDRVGDNGSSFGAFQINLPSHPNITKEQAFDFKWSADWTAKHCLKYKDDAGMFGVCHNGIGKYPRNTWYAERITEELQKI